MLDLEEVKKRLKAGNITAIARDLKIPRSWLTNLANGNPQAANPSYHTVKRISEYLDDVK